MRTVSGVNEDLVVGVSFPLHLLRAVSSRGLTFATGKKTFQSYTTETKNECLLKAGDAGSPVRNGRCDVSVVESGVPRKQDDASVAKHAMEK